MSIGLVLKKAAPVPASNTRTSKEAEEVNEVESDEDFGTFDEYDEEERNNTRQYNNVGDLGFGDNGAYDVRFLITPTPRRGR